MPKVIQLAGRKSKSYDMGPMIRLDLPIFQISAILPRKERYFQKVYEEDFPRVKDDLQKIEATFNEMKLKLPELAKKCRMIPIVFTAKNVTIECQIFFRLFL